MKTLIKLILLIVILHVFFAGCSDTSSDDSSEDELETAIVTADKKATTITLIIEEVRLKRDMRIMYKTLFIFFLHQ